MLYFKTYHSLDNMQMQNDRTPSHLLSGMGNLQSTNIEAVATIVAMTAARAAKGGIATPSIPTLVKVANMPPAGVNAPYIQPWKAAAKDPVRKSTISTRAINPGEAPK